MRNLNFTPLSRRSPRSFLRWSKFFVGFFLLSSGQISYAVYTIGHQNGCTSDHHGTCPKHGCTLSESIHLSNPTATDVSRVYYGNHSPTLMPAGRYCICDVSSAFFTHPCATAGSGGGGGGGGGGVPPPVLCNSVTRPSDGPQRVLKIGTDKLKKVTDIFANSLTNMSEKSKRAGTPTRIFDSQTWTADAGLNVYMQVKPFCCGTTWRTDDTINGEAKFGKMFFTGTWLIPIPIPLVNGRLTLSAEVEPRILVDNATFDRCVSPETFAVSCRVAGKLEAKLGMELALGLVGGSGLANVGMSPTFGLLVDVPNLDISPRPGMRVNWQPKVNVGIEISFLYGAITHQYIRTLDGESFGFL